MIKKYAFTIVFLTTFVFCFAQEQVGAFQNTLKTSYSSVKDVVPIVNEKTGSISLFILDAKNVYLYELNKDFKVEKELLSEAKRRKYKTIIGNSISESGDYRIFLSNKDKKKFMSLNFSFKDNSSTSKEFKLETSKEEFVQTISLNNKFYLIAANPNFDGMFIYTFNDEGIYKRSIIDTSDMKFISKKGRKIILGWLLTYGDEGIKKIDNSLPNSIEVVSSKKKMYIRGSDIFFTFDNNKVYTQLLTLNIKNLEVEGLIYKKPLEETQSTIKKTNSFINGDNIFLLASTNQKLKLRIADFKKGEIKKELEINKKEPIAFKNSPIIQKGGAYKQYRELEKTSKFLRKITTENIGVSIRNVNNKNQITIGGYVNQRRNNGNFFTPFGGTSIASFGNVSVFFNPTMYAYNSMANTKSVVIECLFDNEFNHIKEEKAKKNIFDKMQEHKDSKIGVSVFKYKDYFIKGYYRPSRKMYYLKKFTVED